VTTEDKPPVVTVDEKKVEEVTEEKKVEETKEEKTEEKKKKEEKPVEPPKPRVHKPDFQKDVVYLYQFSRTPVLPSLSPYCLKVETYLRLQGLKYENVDHKLKFKSAKGQLPFVELNGEEINDSAVIIEKLGAHFDADMDANLTKEQRNKAHTLISMIENHTCWTYVYWRCKNSDAWIKGCKVNLQHMLGSRMPNALLNVVFKLTYMRKGNKKVKAHGLGLLAPEEVFEQAKKDLIVLEETLEEAGTDFFFGDKPTNLDVVAFSHLSQIAFVDKAVEYDVRDYFLESCPKLLALVNRIKERAFPDWDEITSTLDLNTHLPKPPPPEEKKEEKEEPAKEKEVEVTKEEAKEAEATKTEETKTETEETKS